MNNHFSLLFLGTGTAFSKIPENYHSNMLLQSPNGKNLLIDCGADARHSLKANGFSFHDIDAVYISHFHSDHVGGLEWLAFARKFSAEPIIKPTLFIHPSMVASLWQHVLAGGLQSIQGEKGADLSTYFNTGNVAEHNGFTWEGGQFELVQTVHVYHGKQLVPSYGLFFTLGTTRLFITTDTQFLPERYLSYYQKADIIFHDCEIDAKHSGVHAHYQDLCGLDKKIKEKMWLYHYAAKKLPDAKKDGFLGFVKHGQEFIIENSM